MKFTSRSILTWDDSYGKSLVAGLWMYDGEGPWDDSSSCKYVGIESGGIGIEAGSGDGKAVSAVEGSNFSSEVSQSKAVPRSSLLWLTACPALFDTFPVRDRFTAEGVDIDRTPGLGLKAELTAFSDLVARSASTKGESCNPSIRSR